ncbi:MAG: ABC transporter ATP-binding protein [Chloroflexi bacterium]|nr:ABC transporter ATP-binding protein [Chloroflexota bacterium]MBI5052786.1 ABC transporter ATP-binding protein [Chloroflexota bacterium]MBI5079821.1 ABC transporter ATP-binding protein [Chloroflexota bacterium]MBI5713314.1 ABC transporter ATP-binding protein [Chloroflexota bacterium]
MIQVEGLTKRYGSRLAIDHLTFHADKGEIVGFLGPNGAGKTTTMRILTGYMPASEGKAIVAGRDVFTDSLEARKRIGYLPETVPLYTEMSVWQYLDFMGELRQLPNRDDRIEEVMESVHMTDRADSLISNLSKGMRQRVGLAQALLHKPEVLILDEPTIGLDPAQVRDVRELIRELGGERTVMLSTHILSEAQAICNRVLIINKGKILAEDTPDRLRARLSGGDRVGVKVMGDGAGLTEALNKVPGVTAVHPIKDGEYEIDAAPGGNIRPEIAKAVVNGGWNLMELKAMGMSLEEIYLQLVREEAEEEEAQNA